MSASLVSVLPWVQALGWTLLHFIWQGLVVGAGFGAVRALLPKNRSNARYAAGLIALLALLLWPLATLIALRPSAAANLAIGAPVQSAAPLAGLADNAGSAALAPIDHLLPLFVLLWCFGVVVVASRALRQWRALARITRDWAHPDGELDALLAGLNGRFGLMRRIRVLVSSRIDTPMLIGWLKPVVLLPTAVALGFPRQQIELILAHELGHLRRYDHLVNLAQALLETLLFYHPVVHWISREVRNERELCCDALVLRLTTGEPREYARTLAALEGLRQPSAQLALGASGGVLVERVRRIVGMPAPRLSAEQHNPARWLLLAGLFAIAITMALRVERGGETRFVGGLTVDWLTQPDVRMLPIAALTLPFERPHLRLAPIALPADPPAIASRPSTATARAAASVGSAMTNAGLGVVVRGALTQNHPVPATALSDTSAAAVNRPVAVRTAEPAARATISVAPVAIRIVTPTFPSFSREAGRIDASFVIAADGSVQDIRIANNEAGGAFARAAERALRQWRFDPATLSAQRSLRYQQSFVFAPRDSHSVATRPESPCVQSTGTHICREPENSGAVTTMAFDARR